MRQSAFSVGGHGNLNEDVLGQIKDDDTPERFLSLDALLNEVGAIKRSRISRTTRHRRKQ